MKFKKSVVVPTVLAAVAVALIVMTRVRHAQPETQLQTKTGEGIAPSPAPAAAPRVAKAHSPQQPVAAVLAPQAQPRNSQIMGRIAKLEVSDAVKTIVGLNDKARDAKSRQKAMQKLTRGLSANDVQGLRLFLDSRSHEERDMEPIYFNSIKNDALDILMRQNKLPENLGADMVRMFQDKQQDDTWRDYCIQYMANYYNARWPVTKDAVETAAPENPERKALEAAYWEAAERRDNTFAGTALLALERLSKNRPEFDRKKVGDKAVEIATDESTCAASRLTSLRICATMNLAQALPAARALAQTGATGPLRMAAMATLGDLGDKTDVELLQSLAASSDKHTKKIVDSALKRLNERVAALEHPAA